MLTAFDLWLCVTIWIEWQQNACIFFYNWSWKWAVLKHSKIRCVDRLECCNFDSKTSLLVGTNCFFIPVEIEHKNRHNWSRNDNFVSRNHWWSWVRLLYQLKRASRLDYIDCHDTHFETCKKFNCIECQFNFLACSNVNSTAAHSRRKCTFLFVHTHNSQLTNRHWNACEFFSNFFLFERMNSEILILVSRVLSSIHSHA